MCQEKKSTESNAHFLGWRKILMNAYYAIDEKLDVKIVYEAEDCGLEIREGKFDSAVFVSLGAFRKILAKTVVDASGGFQADLSWLREYWGAVADNIIIPGPPYDKGPMLRVLLDHGTKPVGDPSQCHAIDKVSSIHSILILLPFRAHNPTDLLEREPINHELLNP